MNNKYLVLLLATIPFWLACGKEELPKQDDDDDKNVTIDWNAAANDGSNALINSFWNANGQYFNTDNNGNTSFQYWPNAHALDVLIDAYLRTNDATYSSYFEKWFVGVKARNGTVGTTTITMTWSGTHWLFCVHGKQQEMWLQGCDTRTLGVYQTGLE